MDGKKLGFITKIKKSVAIPVNYDALLRMSFKEALIFLMILSLFCGTLVVGLPIHRINKYVTYFSTIYQKLLPEFSYQNGKMNFAIDKPKYIQVLDYNLILLEAQTYDKNELETLKNAVIVLENKMIFKKNSHISEFNYPRFSIKFVRDDLVRILSYFKWIALILFIFGIIVYWLKLLLYVIVATIAGMIVFKCKRKEFNLRSTVKLCIFSLTCPILAQLIMEIFGVNIHILSEAIFIISLYYIWKAADYESFAPQPFC